jgi:hypothetical protein
MIGRERKDRTYQSIAASTRPPAACLTLAMKSGSVDSRAASAPHVLATSRRSALMSGNERQSDTSRASERAKNVRTSDDNLSGAAGLGCEKGYETNRAFKQMISARG